MKLKHLTSGFSLIEILVTVTVFAVLGILATQVLLVSIQGAKKSEMVIKDRENLSYALSVMERQLRNANSITSCTGTSVTFLDSENVVNGFACHTGDFYSETDQYVASGSGTSVRITNPETVVLTCSFVCDLSELSGFPDRVTLNLGTKRVNYTTTIELRTY